MVTARNSNLWGGITILLIICCCGLSAQGKYGGGSGTAEDPYQIWTAGEMNAIGADSNDWDKHFKLMADIDLSSYTGTEFNIIGTGYFESPHVGFPYLVATPFAGNFDGDNYEIVNFTYDYRGKYIIGLFGVVDGENAEIKDLGLREPNVAGEVRVGSLIGYLRDGSATDCYVEGGSVSGDAKVGGLIGSTGGGTLVSNCRSITRVSAGYDVGGLIAINGGMAVRCYSKASVVGGNHVGGLTGFNTGSLSDCNSAGEISGESYTGGLVGDNRGQIHDCFSTASVRSDGWAAGGLIGSSSGTVFNCRATGSISGKDAVGGLFGVNWSGIVTNCYASGGVSGNIDVGGLAGKVLEYGTVTQCYSTGNVSGHDRVGGLVGQTLVGSTASNCYAAGYVTGNTNVGGLMGYDNSGCYSKCFWDNTINPLLTGIGNTTDPNVIGESTANMQMKNTFVEAGWDFVGEYENGPSDDWAEPNSGGYMILWWQLSPLPPLPAFSCGTGEPIDSYLILSPAELNHIGHNPRLMGKHFTLIDDIDLTGTNFFIIGNSVFPFAGSFDGNSKTISNFTYRCTNQSDIGLFACISDIHAEIKDLSLKVSCIEAETADKVGTLVGILEAGTICGCHTKQSNVSGKRYVGGLVGFNRNGTILNCTSSGRVSGHGYVGGLVGSNSGIIYNCISANSVVSGDDKAVGGLVGRHMHIYRPDFEIHYCYATGSVSADRWVGGVVGVNMGPISKCGSSSSVLGNNEVGGLVGYNNSTIRNCHSTGSISGTTYVGGLAGRNRYRISDCYSQSSVLGNSRVGGLVGLNDNEISNCYSAGSVSGHDGVGGLAGVNEGGTLSNSLWDIQTSGMAISDGGEGKTTAEMQQQSTFTGWDFVTESINGTDDIWAICEAVDYPKLTWQFVIGDFDGDNDTDFADFSILAGRWLGTNGSFWCGDGCDLTNDGYVGYDDLKEWAENWMTGVE